MKFIIFLFYRAVAMKLPKSNTPFVGKISKKIRVAVVSKLFKSVGVNVNVERGARFGYKNNIVIGDNSGIGINANIPPDITIGNNVMMGPDCVIYAANHKFDETSIPMNQQGHEPMKKTIIGNDVWIGGRVIMMPGKTIGDGVIVGAGSVVTKDLESYGIYGGNPAKLIKMRK